jgi:aryl carrier-like protein
VKELSQEARSVPIGRPIANTQVYLLSGYEQPAPIGVSGEIYIGGAGTAQCYLNHADLTGERFVPDPIGQEAGGRLYKTGDLGRWLSDGAIEFLGRKDFQVKIRGVRVELGEIEAHLGSHPAVRKCVVVAHQDDGAEKRLTAYLVCEAETEPSDRELRDYLLERLPVYMLPSSFVRLEEMTLTANGKVDSGALPAPGTVWAGRQYEAPIGTTEIDLARIWARALGVERVSRTDNFFELGGHSLLAVRLIQQMRREGIQCEVRTLFTDPTLAEFAAAIEDEDMEVAL